MCFGREYDSSFSLVDADPVPMHPNTPTPQSGPETGSTFAGSWKNTYPPVVPPDEPLVLANPPPSRRLTELRTLIREGCYWVPVEQVAERIVGSLNRVDQRRPIRGFGS